MAPEVSGLRAYGSSRISTDDDTGMIELPADTVVTVEVFGSSFSNSTILAFTHVAADRGVSCADMALSQVINFNSPTVQLDGNVAVLRMQFPASPADTQIYLCVKYMTENGEHTGWIHQGSARCVTFRSVGRLLPIWVQACIVITLLILSGLFSGLNLGLMSLDNTELKVIESCGTPSEQKCAKAIAPLRKNGNYLLCSLLLGNVLVNSTLTILLDDLTSGLIAILGSTMAIVVFGEIIPQAICSRHGLEVGARTLIITKIFMVLTFLASYPISRALDYVLGEEIGHVYDREKLIQYIKLTMDYTQLANEEVNIISGALELKTKQAGHIMTRIDDVFMLPYNTVLDFETVSNIIRQGYTRIPIYEGNRDTIVGLLNIKDLAFIDPGDAFPLKTVCDFYKHPLTYCFEDQCLDELLDEFKKGKSHMSIVQSIRMGEGADPVYSVVGIVTLEDVIEEILKIEIVDETDVLTDNRERKKRKEVQLSKQDFTDFAKINARSVIPAPLALATFQFLSTAVEPFKREYVSENVLRRLMVQNIFIHIKADELADDSRKFIYRAGKATDYFALLLEGRAKVTLHTSANEELQHEAGPFSYFGVPAIFLLPVAGQAGEGKFPGTADNSASQLSLASPASECIHLAERAFTPDYSVEAVTNVLYMRVHRSVYAAAYKTSRLDRSNRSTAASLETEWANVLNALNTSNRHRNTTGGGGPTASVNHNVGHVGQAATTTTAAPAEAFSAHGSLTCGNNTSTPTTPAATTAKAGLTSGAGKCHISATPPTSPRARTSNLEALHEKSTEDNDHGTGHHQQQQQKYDCAPGGGCMDRDSDSGKGTAKDKDMSEKAPLLAAAYSANAPPANFGFRSSTYGGLGELRLEQLGAKRHSSSVMTQMSGGIVPQKHTQQHAYNNSNNNNNSNSNNNNNNNNTAGTPCLSSASFSGPPVLAAPLTRSSDASIASIPLHELHTTMAVQPSSTTQQQVIRSPESNKSVIIDVVGSAAGTAAKGQGLPLSTGTGNGSKGARPPAGLPGLSAVTSSSANNSRASSGQQPQQYLPPGSGTAREPLEPRDVNERTLLLSGHTSSSSSSSSNEHGVHQQPPTS
ncbi:metal transporter CNNM4-like isoform X1 [Varroa jacobsoni]|uniref:metal transporter CNNM4-like isoform X1 n=1 Tax=Varroa jacobsoni TaxID=62625 RepID=UPI000BF6E198|nr:metal transporter CNNM4-like isoform X1 [Varroa jacobsoni]